MFAFVVISFNAWTGCIPDFVNFDEEVTIKAVGQHRNNNISKLGFELYRNSSHKATHNYGQRLIQLCKNLDMYIANGRLGVDRYFGRPTCNNNSVVDYLIISPELLPFRL